MELKKKIITLSEKELDIISTCIAETLKNDVDNHIEAVYINAYSDEEGNLIDVQFVDNSIYSLKREVVDVSKERVIIRKITVPRINFSYGLNHTREICNAIDLLNSQIIMDKDSYYSDLANLAQKFGYGDYSDGALIEPPISLPEVRNVKKLK